MPTIDVSNWIWMNLWFLAFTNASLLIWCTILITSLAQKRTRPPQEFVILPLPPLILNQLQPKLSLWLSQQHQSQQSLQQQHPVVNLMNTRILTLLEVAQLQQKQIFLQGEHATQIAHIFGIMKTCQNNYTTLRVSILLIAMPTSIHYHYQIVGVTKDAWNFVRRSTQRKFMYVFLIAHAEMESQCSLIIIEEDVYRNQLVQNVIINLSIIIVTRAIYTRRSKKETIRHLLAEERTIHGTWYTYIF